MVEVERDLLKSSCPINPAQSHLQQVAQDDILNFKKKLFNVPNSLKKNKKIQETFNGYKTLVQYLAVTSGKQGHCHMFGAWKKSKCKKALHNLPSRTPELEHEHSSVPQLDISTTFIVSWDPQFVSSLNL